MMLEIPWQLRSFKKININQMKIYAPCNRLWNKILPGIWLIDVVFYSSWSDTIFLVFPKGMIEIERYAVHTRYVGIESCFTRRICTALDH